jgi:hypothetical protein
VKPERRKPLGKPRRRWEDNIKMNVRRNGMGACSGSIWHRIRIDEGLL